MTAIFCCTSINAYRPTRTEHELKFWTFTNWATYPQASAVDDTFGHKHGYIASSLGPYAIQLVKQTKFGPLESKRYFVLNTIDVSEDQSAGQGRRQRYAEVKERYLIDGNYKKVNSQHNKFFEVNLYQVDPHNKHHWRSDIARPGSEIDI